MCIRDRGTDEAIDEAKQQLDPENLHDSALDRYIYPRSGLERKAATFAHGSLTVTGTGTVEQGTLFESGGGVQYYATETVAIEGEGTVPVTCTVDGLSLIHIWSSARSTPADGERHRHQTS